jgi:hypothetical protein
MITTVLHQPVVPGTPADEINVDLGDGRIFPMPRHQLDGPYYERTENAHEVTTVTIYKYQGKVVHRSPHVTLKRGIGIEAVIGRLG